MRTLKLRLAFVALALLTMTTSCCPNAHATTPTEKVASPQRSSQSTNNEVQLKTSGGPVLQTRTPLYSGERTNDGTVVAPKVADVTISQAPARAETTQPEKNQNSKLRYIFYGGVALLVGIAIYFMFFGKDTDDFDNAVDYDDEMNNN